MICPVCEKDCSDKDKRGRPRMVCSQRCAAILEQQRKGRFLISCNCDFCGQQIKIRPYRFYHNSKSGKHYCSKSCKSKAEIKKKRIVVLCNNCGRKIEKCPSQIYKFNFCNLKCLGFWLRQFVGQDAFNWKGGYKKDERNRIRGRKAWKELRQQVLINYNYHCALCGATENIHIHHITPWRLGGKDEISNLISLCPRCHSKQTVKDWEYEHKISWKESGAHTFERS